MRDAHAVPSADLDFGLLGPLEVRRHGEPLALGGVKQRAVLAVLLANAGRTLSTASIADAVWDGEPGDRSDATLQVYVSTLRKVLGSDGDEARRVLVTAAPGYRLDVRPEQTDVGRFRTLRDQGVRQLASGDADKAAATLRTALGLWRGRPMDDLRELRFATEAAIPLGTSGCAPSRRGSMPTCVPDAMPTSSVSSRHWFQQSH